MIHNTMQLTGIGRYKWMPLHFGSNYVSFECEDWTDTEVRLETVRRERSTDDPSTGKPWAVYQDPRKEFRATASTARQVPIYSLGADWVRASVVRYGGSPVHMTVANDERIKRRTAFLGGTKLDQIGELLERLSIMHVDSIDEFIEKNGIDPRKGLGDIVDHLEILANTK